MKPLGSVRRDKSGNGWIIDVSHRGTRRTGRARSKAEALEKQRRLSEEVLAGHGRKSATQGAQGEFTLTDAMRLSERVRWRGTPYERTALIYARAVVEALGGDTLVDTVTPPMALDLRERFLRTDNTASTVNKKMSALSAMLRDAVEHGHLASMPHLPRRLRPGGERKRIFQPGEILSISSWLVQSTGGPAAADLFVFLLETAARWGEAERLRGRDVDLKRKTVTFWRTKNGDPRTIPLTGRALDCLERNMPVLTHHHVWDFTYERYRRLFGRALAEVGLGDEPLSVHTTRHTAATKMAQAGVSQAQLMAYGGWTSLSSVQRYMHVDTRRLHDCVEALEGGRRVDAST